MKVCDLCKKVPIGIEKARKPFDYIFVGTKVEEKKRGREIVKIEMHLCDRCITDFNSKFGTWLQGMRFGADPE